MATFKKVRRCVACDAVLQTDDPDKEGFIDTDIIENHSYRILYCNKCFQEKLKNNISVVSPDINPGFYKVLSDAIEKKAVIIYPVDLFSYEDSFNLELMNFLTKNDAKVFVVGLKKDLFPKNIDEEYLLNSLRRHLSRVGLTYTSATIAEANTKEGIQNVVDYVLKVSQGKDIYLLGSRHVGKTAIIDAYFRNYENTTGRLITTATYPETDLRLTAIPLPSGGLAYDTPGLGIENSLLSKVEATLVRALRPKKSIERRSFTIPYGAFVTVGGFAVLVNSGTDKTNIDCYFTSELEIFRILPPRTPDYLFKMIKRGYAKPYSKDFTTLSDFEVFDIALDNDDRMVDITIFGLGFFTIQQKGQILRLYVPKGVSLGVYDSKINYLDSKKAK